VLSTGHLATQVEVNGKAGFEFLVDTAASMTSTLPPLREVIELPAHALHAGELHGASGSTRGVQLQSIDSLTVDDRVHRQVDAVALAGSARLPAVAGILGADLLSRYIVEFDIPAGQLHLHDRSAAPARRDDWIEIPFSLNNVRFPIIKGTLDGSPISVLLDTGARRTIMNVAAARMLGVQPGESAQKATDSVQGATAHSTDAVKRDFDSLRLGAWSIDPRELTIADLAVFKVLGGEKDPYMILGMDKLKERRFIVDYAGGRLLMMRPPGAADASAPVRRPG
jgi:predicted aspartyl protease